MFGYEFELIDRRLAWGEDRVYFYDRAGAMVRMPAEWTSAGAVDAFVQISAGRSYFRVMDLLRLAELVESLVGGAASDRGKGKVSRE
jgi:hypothetical protein